MKTLTPRQKQIIRLILAGKVNKEIAVELKIAHTTVINTSAAAFRRLGINDVRQLFPLVDDLRVKLAD